MNTYRGFRDALRSFIPIWLQDRPGFRNGYKFLYVCALLVDIALKWCVESVYAWFPGYSLGATQGVSAASALPLIGQSRGMLQGLGEADASFAQRLIGWLDDWEAAGSSEILVAQIQAYLGTSPTVRVVDRAGNWTSIDPSGDITTTSAAWDWDEVGQPERVWWWSDLWIIVYPCPWPITGTTLSSLVGVWGTYNGIGTGHQVPRGPVDAILGLLELWKGAHCWCESIIWSYDSSLFVPGSPASGDPNGTWAFWGYPVSGELKVARTGSADGRCRYWIPPGG